jgi:molybdopterin converting factor small subunit
MRIEFFGVSRERTGASDVELHAETLGELFDTLAIRFPALAELLGTEGPRASVVANLNGERFVVDRETRLASDDCVLILSADAGG